MGTTRRDFVKGVVAIWLAGPIALAATAEETATAKRFSIRCATFSVLFPVEEITNRGLDSCIQEAEFWAREAFDDLDRESLHGQPLKLTIDSEAYRAQSSVLFYFSVRERPDLAGWT